jgi:hypothetical protein
MSRALSKAIQCVDRKEMGPVACCHNRRPFVFCHVPFDVLNGIFLTWTRKECDSMNNFCVAHGPCFPLIISNRKKSVFGLKMPENGLFFWSTWMNWSISPCVCISCVRVVACNSRIGPQQVRMSWPPRLNHNRKITLVHHRLTKMSFLFFGLPFISLRRLCLFIWSPHLIHPNACR